MDQESIEPSRAQTTPEDPIAEPPRYDHPDASTTAKDQAATPIVEAPQPADAKQAIPAAEAQPQITAPVAEVPASPWQQSTAPVGQPAAPVADVPQSPWQSVQQPAQPGPVAAERRWAGVLSGAGRLGQRAADRVAAEPHRGQPAGVPVAAGRTDDAGQPRDTGRAAGGRARTRRSGSRCSCRGRRRSEPWHPRWWRRRTCRRAGMRRCAPISCRSSPASVGASGSSSRRRPWSCCWSRA